MIYLFDSKPTIRKFKMMGSKATLKHPKAASKQVKPSTFFVNLRKAKFRY